MQEDSNQQQNLQPNNSDTPQFDNSNNQSQVQNTQQDENTPVFNDSLPPENAERPIGYEQPAEPNSVQETSQPITWVASEYIAHEKNATWYLKLASIAILVAGLMFLITRDYLSAFVVLFGAFILGFYGARKPRQLNYELNNSSLIIENKEFPYNELKTFSLVREGAFSSINFVPHKRFGPLITIYYAPEDEARIIDALSAHLPFEERKVDPVDQLMRKIRF